MTGGPVSRRDFVKAAVITASAAALGVGAISSVLPAFSGGPVSAPSPLLKGSGTTATATPLTVRDLDGPAVVAAPAVWKYLPAIVLKLRKATLQAAAEHRGYNTGQFALQHPTEPDHVIVAYDAKCTHLGCTVAFNATLGAAPDVDSYEGEPRKDGRILCPCHQAQFDVYDLANHVVATPAPRPLDVLVIGFGPAQDGSPTLEASRRIRQDKARDADQGGDGFELAG